MNNVSEITTGLPKVKITAEHMDRALKAIMKDIPSLTQSEVGIDGVYYAGGVIAFMEALDDKLDLNTLLAALAEEVMGEYDLRHFVMEKHGLLDPVQIARLREGMDTAKRLEAERAAEIEAEVQKRLAEAA